MASHMGAPWEDSAQAVVQAVQLWCLASQFCQRLGVPYFDGFELRAGDFF